MSSSVWAASSLLPAQWTPLLLLPPLYTPRSARTERRGNLLPPPCKNTKSYPNTGRDLSPSSLQENNSIYRSVKPLLYSSRTDATGFGGNQRQSGLCLGFSASDELMIDSAIPPHVKADLRPKLVELLDETDGPVRRASFAYAVSRVWRDAQIGKSVEICIARMAKWDYDADWPDLPNILLSLLTANFSSRPIIARRALSTLKHIIKTLSSNRMPRARLLNQRVRSVSLDSASHKCTHSSVKLSSLPSSPSIRKPFRPGQPSRPPTPRQISLKSLISPSRPSGSSSCMAGRRQTPILRRSCV